MRSFFKLPGTVFVAAAALFAVVASTSTANAMMLRDTAPLAAAVTGPESVEKVAVRWWEAWRARRDVARALRQDCRDESTRRERRECRREAWSDMQREARNTYRDCRTDGGRRSECRQGVWQYWVDQANGGGSSGGSTGGSTGGGDTGPVPDPDDLPR